jgi:hypothetical protein
VTGVGTIEEFEDNLQIVPTELGIRFIMNPKGNVIPYLGGGVSFFWVNVNDGSASNPIGAYALFGINFGGSKVKFFAEGLYRYAKSDITYRYAGDIRWTGEMDVGGFAANAGVIWTF